MEGKSKSIDNKEALEDEDSSDLRLSVMLSKRES
jgi:hypothetical protein